MAVCSMIRIMKISDEQMNTHCHIKFVSHLSRHEINFIIKHIYKITGRRSVFNGTDIIIIDLPRIDKSAA